MLRKVGKRIAFVVYLVLLAEIGSRAFWAVRHVPFFDPEKIWRVFYPELAMPREGPHTGLRPVRILLLGASTMNAQYSFVETALREALTSRLASPLYIHNVAVAGHTTLDSRYKYLQLRDERYDLVVIYHGINDTRANNCPATLFRRDYSHYGWYEKINALAGDSSSAHFALPYTVTFAFLAARERAFAYRYVPVGAPRQEWLKYGREIKTAAAFEDNLRAVLALASDKREGVLLMTFASCRTCSERALSVAKAPECANWWCPTELWGEPDAVREGIDTHNQVIRKLHDEFPSALYVDQAALMMGQEEAFCDVCHLTREGARRFVSNMIDSIASYLQHRSDQPHG